MRCWSGERGDRGRFPGRDQGRPHHHPGPRRLRLDGHCAGRRAQGGPVPDLHDVDGVYTADPRIVPSARKLPEISYDEMLELASLGAKVMQSRSVEFAKKFGVVFEVRSSLNDNPGTIVKEETKNMEDVVIRGVSLDKNQAKVTLVAVPDNPAWPREFSRRLATRRSTWT